MGPPQHTVVLKLMVWLWVVLTLGSLTLTFFPNMTDAFVVPFILGPVSLPVIVLDSIFHGSSTMAVAMFFVVIITLAELGFLLYNSIQAISNADEFAPIQDHITAFFLLLVMSFVRLVLGFFIVAFMGKVRKIPFEERCNAKPHKV